MIITTRDTSNYEEEQAVIGVAFVGEIRDLFGLG